MLPFKLIYHESYDLHLGAHVFPSQKFRLVHDKLLNDGIAQVEDFLRPEPASDEDILRVHTGDWVHKLKTGTLSHSEQMNSKSRTRPNLSAPSGWPPVAPSSPLNPLCAMASAATSAAASTTPFPATAKVSAPFTMSPSPFALCSHAGKSTAPWSSIPTSTTATAPPPFSPRIARSSPFRSISSTITRLTNRIPRLISISKTAWATTIILPPCFPR